MKPALLLRSLFLLAALLAPSLAHAEDGYDLWLRYRPVEKAWLAPYAARAALIVEAGSSPTLDAARDELARGLSGMLGHAVPQSDSISRDGAIVIGTPATSPSIAKLGLPLEKLGREGYLIRSVTAKGHKVTIIAANSDVGVLYGTFRFLSLMQTRQPIDTLDIAIGAAPRASRARSLGQSRPHDRARLCRLFDLGLAEAAGLQGPALHRLRPRRCFARHQRRDPQQCRRPGRQS